MKKVFSSCSHSWGNQVSDSSVITHMMTTPLAYDKSKQTQYWRWKWSCSVMFDSFGPHGLQPTRFLRSWDFPGKGTGVGFHFLLSTQCWQIQSSFNCITESVWSWNTTRHISVFKVTIILSWNYELHFSSGSILQCFTQLYIGKYCTTTLKKCNQHRCLAFCIIPLFPLMTENLTNVSPLFLLFPCLCFVILLSGLIVFYQHLPFPLALLLPWSP